MRLVVNFLLNYLSSNNIFYLYFFLLEGVEILLWKFRPPFSMTADEYKHRWFGKG